MVRHCTGTCVEVSSRVLRTTLWAATVLGRVPPVTKTNDDLQVADGRVVLMHYRLEDGQGELIDSSEGEQPMDYLHGAGNIVPGLETALAGCKAGAHVSAKVAPADGYGEATELQPMAVPRSDFPDDIELDVGMQFFVEDDQGEAVPMWIDDVEENQVFITTQHPLAGVTLCFEIDVVSVRESTEEERAHGHPHGPEGHHH